MDMHLVEAFSRCVSRSVFVLLSCILGALERVMLGFFSSLSLLERSCIFFSILQLIPLISSAYLGFDAFLDLAPFGGFSCFFLSGGDSARNLRSYPWACGVASSL
jgi:hypothetical protein